MKPPIDWEAVRADFLMHRELSLADLARKHHTSVAKVREVCTRDHWHEQREARSQQIAHDALAQSAAEQAAMLADVNADCLRAAQAGIGKFNVMLAQCTKPHEGRALLGMLRDAQAVALVSLGAPTENVRQIPPDEDVDSARARAFQAMLDLEADTPQ